jgi:hypothetical protein
LLVDDPDHAGRLRLHRFAEFTPDGNLILRGDANSANDSTPVAPAAVHGVAVLRIPFVGLPVVWLAEKNWGPFAAVLAVVAGLTLAAASGSGAAPGSPEPRPREESRRDSRPLIRKTRTVQTFLAVAVIPGLVCAALVTASPAHAAFSATVPVETSSFSARSSFPCLSELPEAYKLDEPSLFYSFQETSGPVIDASGNKRHGTLEGTTTRVAGSCIRNDSPALTLDGVTGHVSTPTAVPAPNEFTVEIWFKTTIPTTGGKLIGFGDAQTGPSTISDRHLYMTDDGKIAFGIATPSGSKKFKGEAIVSPKSYNDGQWHQAAATVTTAGANLYIDGERVVPTDKNIPLDKNVTTGHVYSGFWRIGYDTMDLDKIKKEWPGVSGDPIFAGTVDNAAVYPSALTAAQVKAHFDAGR